jgi:ornithine cyclodeaminase
MDAGHLTSLRASLVSALAADVLARPDARNVAVLGSGTAASGALKALRLVRSIDRVWMHEPDVASNFERAFRLQNALSMDLKGVDSAAEAVAEADLVVLTGGVPLPADALKPGTHVTVLAAETFAQNPLPPELLARARRFCDLNEPPLAWGGPFHAELGEVLARQQPGRTSPDELTVFVSLGPAYLDLLAAWHVYEGAKNDESLTRVDLEA